MSAAHPLVGGRITSSALKGRRTDGHDTRMGHRTIIHSRLSPSILRGEGPRGAWGPRVALRSTRGYGPSLLRGGWVGVQQDAVCAEFHGHGLPALSTAAIAWQSALAEGAGTAGRKTGSSSLPQLQRAMAVHRARMECMVYLRMRSK